MIEYIDSDKSKKYRIWIDEEITKKIDFNSKISKKLKATNEVQWEESSITAEVLFSGLMVSSYALLNIQYISNNSEYLEIVVKISDTEEELKKNIALKPDRVYFGILKEYAEVVLKTSIEKIEEIGTIPSGILTYEFGAHGEVASSQNSFSKLSKVLVEFLIRDIKTLRAEEIYKIIFPEEKQTFTSSNLR